MEWREVSAGDAGGVTERPLRLGEALVRGWNAMWRHPGPAIGGLALYGVISIAIGSVPLVGLVLQVLVLPPLVGGAIVLSLNIVDDRKPTIGDLFAGFQAYGKWMGVYWLYYAIVLIGLLPVGLAVLIGYFAFFHGGTELPETLAVPLAGLVALLVVGLLAGLVAVLMRYAFVYYAGAEKTGVLEAFGESAALTKGRRLALFWMSVVLGLVYVGGVLAVGLGLLVTMPLSMCAWAALYRQVKPAAAPVVPPEEAMTGPGGDGGWSGPSPEMGEVE